MSRSTRLDWARSMAVKWSWWRVNPETWRDMAPMDAITSAGITFDAGTDTLASGSLEADGDDLWGETWARCYLEATQGKRSERICVATLMLQSPSRTLESAYATRSIDGYGPLAALRDERVGVGWYASAGTPTLGLAASLARQYGVAPVTEPAPNTYTLSEPWVAGESDTALDVVRELAAMAGHEVACTPDGTTQLLPTTRISALVPQATLTDDRDTGTVLAGLEDAADWYEVPNVVEVVHSEDTRQVLAIAINDDPASELSTVRRGRRVVARVTNPDELGDGCTQADADALAAKLLSDRSCMVREVSYIRGFDPRVELGDCVRVLMPDRGIDVTGRVTKQEVECTTEATVRETITTQERMWVR